MQTDRDRLIELIFKSEYSDFPCHLNNVRIEDFADYLLANGVIVPPCKVGDDIYWIDSDTNEIKCQKNDIKAVCYYGEGKFKIISKNENTPEDIGTRWCMLTKEEAEAELKECEDK